MRFGKECCTALTLACRSCEPEAQSVQMVHILHQLEEGLALGTVVTVHVAEILSISHTQKPHTTLGHDLPY